MSSHTDSHFSPSEHHYPSTSADWVTSPLGPEDGLIAPSRPAVPSLLRVGTVATLTGGLFAVAGSGLQYSQLIQPMFWFLWLSILAVFLAMGTALGSILLLSKVTPRITRQVLAFAFLSAAVQVAVCVAFALLAASAIVLRGAGVWALVVSLVSILLLLVGGSILRSIGRLTLSSQELADLAAEERRTWEYTRGDKFLGGWRRHWNPPQTGN